MTKSSSRITGVLVALFVACGAGAAFAQTAGGGNGGGNGGGAGGGATTVPAAIAAVVPNNTTRQPEQRMRIDGGVCVTPTEGIRGPRSIGSCAPY